MSTVLVRYRIARTGEPVPSGSPPPPDYVPWPHAPITWTRIESDYGPGIVRPRDSLTTRADEHGEGSVWLAPGRYRITLPSRESYDRTVSADLPEIDLSALLAGGGVEPDDPQYPTLAAYVVDQIGVALEDQLDAIDEAVETAGESATTAQAARDAAVSAQAVTEAARDAAIDARDEARIARTGAETAAVGAGLARDQAVVARTDAQDAASEASQSATDAADAAALAGTHRSAAESAAGDAAGSASAAEDARTGAETARTQAQGYATTAGDHATQTGLDAAATAADRLAVSQDRQAIESEQAARLAAIEAAGDTQVGRVEDEGDTQVQRVIDAGDELAITVPDPAPQPDGRVLVTRGGTLAYAPDLAAAVAVAGASPALVTIYETGRRAVGAPVSAYGRQTDSGHTWVAVPGSAGTPLLSYHPDGYLLGDHSPRTTPSPDAIGMSIVDHVLPAQSQYRVGVVMDAGAVPNWTRYLVVAETADGDRLMLGAANYEVSLWAVADGVVTQLASWGTLNQGDIGTAGWTEVSAWVHRTHINYSATGRAVDTYVRGRYLGRVPLPEAFAGSPVRVGLAVPVTTPIVGFWLMRG